MVIIYSPRFASLYRKLPMRIKHIAEARVDIFHQDPFNSILNTHKLQGKLSGLWSFSIDYHYRIIFEFGNKNTIYFHTIGTYEIYKI